MIFSTGKFYVAIVEGNKEVVFLESAYYDKMTILRVKDGLMVRSWIWDDLIVSGPHESHEIANSVLPTINEKFRG